MYIPGTVIDVNLCMEQDAYFSQFIPYPTLQDINHGLLRVNKIEYPNINSSQRNAMSNGTPRPLPEGPTIQCYIENYLKFCNNAQRIALGLNHLTSMSTNNPGMMLLYQQKYKEWLREIDLIASATNWIQENLTKDYLLLHDNDEEVLWLVLPNTTQPIPINIKYWRKVYVQGIENNEIVCYEAMLFGGFPTGTQLYYHNKVYQL